MRRTRVEAGDAANVQEALLGQDLRLIGDRVLPMIRWLGSSAGFVGLKRRLSLDIIKR